MKNELKDVLIVDDEPDIRTVVQIALEKMGNLKVHTCGNGKEAIEYLEFGTPQLILMDMMMPEMDGLSILKTLQSRDVKIPIVFLTARVLPGEKAELLSSGAVDLIEKPFDPLTLHERLSEIWSRIRSGSAG